MTLDEWLNKAYAAKVLTKEPYADVVARAKSALAEDPTLRAQAAKRRTELAAIPSITQRCFASAIHLEFLAEVTTNERVNKKV